MLNWIDHLSNYLKEKNETYDGFSGAFNKAIGIKLIAVVGLLLVAAINCYKVRFKLQMIEKLTK